MIFADSNTKIFIILDTCCESASRRVVKFLDRGHKVHVYLLSTESEIKPDFDLRAEVIYVSSSDLPAKIADDFVKSTQPILILFEDEEFLSDYSANDKLKADFKVCRFSNFYFLQGYQHCDSKLLKYSKQAAGFTCQPEKRLFQSGSESPKLALSHTGCWTIKNQAKDTEQLIFNTYFSSAEIETRSQVLIDQPLSSYVWKQKDFTDLTMRRLKERKFKDSLWAISQAAKFPENRKFILQLEALINILNYNLNDFEMIRMNLSSREMLDLPESCFLLAEIASLQGLQKESTEILKAIDSKLPGYALVAQRLGRIFMGINENVRAREYFMRSLKADPYNPVTLLDLAQLELQADKIEEAEKLIDLALLNPGVESRVFLQKAYIYRKKMQPKQVLINLESYIEFEQSCPETFATIKFIPDIKKEIENIKSFLNANRP